MKMSLTKFFTMVCNMAKELSAAITTIFTSVCLGFTESTIPLQRVVLNYIKGSPHGIYTVWYGQGTGFPHWAGHRTDKLTNNIKSSLISDKLLHLPQEQASSDHSN